MAERQERRQETQQASSGGGLQRSQGRGREMAPWRDPFDLIGPGPFSMFRRMQEEMDRLFGSMFGSWGSPFLEEGRSDWRPAIEAFQRGKEFVVRADVPGLSRDDLHVEVDEDRLTIRGERRHDYQEERGGIFRSERAYGTFCRVVPLPEGADTENARANFSDGVLEVVIPTPERRAARGRSIEISAGAPSSPSEQTH